MNIFFFKKSDNFFICDIKYLLLFLELTLGILRHAKRYHTTVSFIADTGLKESKEKGTLIYLITPVSH